MTADHLSCRDAFEKWAHGKVCMLDRDPDFGGYVFSAVNAYWIAWQAAWNTRAPEGEVVACRLFDGEGGYMYTDDEETIKRWTKVKDGWTDLLYTHPPRATSAEDARKAFAFDALVAAGFVTQAKADESLALADAAMAQRGEVG